MQPRNGASFGEYAVLRAIAAYGGEVTPAQLASIGIEGALNIVNRMLPTKARHSLKAKTKITRAGKVRPPLLRLVRPQSRKGGSVRYCLTPQGMAAVRLAGPWLSETDHWVVEWTADWVEVRRSTRQAKRQAQRSVKILKRPATPGILAAARRGGDLLLGKFSESGVVMHAEAGRSVYGRPNDADWKAFQKAMADTYGATVVSEAKPDFLRWPAALLANKASRTLDRAA